MSDTKNSIDLSWRKADKTAEGVQVFLFLMKMVKKGMENQVYSLEELQGMAQQGSGNPLQGLQRLQSMNIHRALRKSWLEVSFHPSLWNLVRAVAQREMTVSQQMKSWVEDKLKSVQHYAVEVQVKGKTEWDLGVARESIKGKEDVPLSSEDG